MTWPEWFLWIVFGGIALVVLRVVVWLLRLIPPSAETLEDVTHGQSGHHF